jgi:hypothetical protein
MSDSVSITVKTNHRTLNNQLRRAFRRQLPFAVAKALTRTAHVSARRAQRDMVQRFTIRSKTLPRAAIKVIRAEKTDWPRPRAIIYVPHKFKFLVMHETGGVKKAEGSAKNVAVPSPYVARRRTAKGKVRARLKPRRLIQEERVRTARTSPTLAFMIQKRVRRSKGQGRRRGVLYYLKRRVKIKRRWRLRQTVERAAARAYPVAFKVELAKAIRGRKGK